MIEPEAITDTSRFAVLWAKEKRKVELLHAQLALADKLADRMASAIVDDFGCTEATELELLEVIRAYQAARKVGGA